MRATNNFILITIETEYENKISSPSGFTLDLVSFDKPIVDGMEEGGEIIYNNLEKKRIWGTVVAVPDKLIFNADDPVIIRELHPTLPVPERYISHELIKKVGPIQKCYCLGNCTCEMLLKYGCFVYEPEYFKISDIKMNVQVGDKIYFHYGTIEKENRIMLPGGVPLYKLGYQNALCVVRDGEIIPCSGNCLVESLFEEEADLGTGTTGIVTKSGLIAKVGSEAKLLEGIVRYTCEPLRGEEIDFFPGDKVIFKKHSRWRIIVEGKEYLCIKYWDIEAVIEEETV